MKKSIWKISMLLMILLLIFSVSVQAAITTGYKFGITNQRTDGEDTYIYAFLSKNNGNEYVWNVQRKNGAIAVTNEVYYCLAHGYGNFGSFGSEVPNAGIPTVTGGDSASSYSGAYNLKENGVINTIRSVYSGTNGNTLTGTKYNSVLWILDHMYIDGDDNIDEFLAKIPWIDDGNFGLDECSNIYEVMQLTLENPDDDLTSRDIEVVQQLAIWYFTNPESVDSFPTIKISKNNGIIETYDKIFTSKIGTVNAGTLREYYAKMIFNYLVDGGVQAATDEYEGDNITTALAYINSEAQPVVRVTREKELTGEYSVIVKKTDVQGNILPGAKFNINGEEKITGNNGTINIGTQSITESNYQIEDIYTITETEAPNGYLKYDGTISLKVTKKEAENGTEYVVNTAILDDTSKNSSYVSIDYNTKTITVTVKDEPIVGDYLIKVVKKDEEGNVLPGAVFTVEGKNYTTDNLGNTIIASSVLINKDNVNDADTYTIVETTAPNGYTKYAEEIKLTVTKKLDEEGLSYIIDTATLDETSINSGHVTINNDTRTITIEVKNDEIPGEYSVVIKKKNEAGELLSGVVFKLDGVELPATNANGEVEVITNAIINRDNVDNTDTYTITEKEALSGYKTLNGDIKLEINKERVNSVYRVKDVKIDTTDNVTYELDNERKIITLNVVNEKIVGTYSVKINKQNERGEVLQGAIFTVNLNQYTTDENGNAIIENNKLIDYTNVNIVDEYNITEIKAPNGYTKYAEEIKLTVTKKLDEEGLSYIIDTATLDETSINSGHVTINNDTRTITIEVKNDEIPGEYSVVIKKKNEAGELLSGVVFKLDGVELPATNANGEVEVITNAIINRDNVDNTDTYTITEKEALSGYKTLNGDIKLEINKEKVNSVYRVKDVKIDTTDNVTYELDNERKIITLNVVNEKIVGTYSVKINKQNERGEVLQGAIFTVNSNQYTTDENGNAIIENNKLIDYSNVNIVDEYNITEIKAPDGYKVYDGTITLTVTKKRDGEILKVNTVSLDETSKSSNRVRVELDTLTNTVTVIVIEEEIVGAYTVRINKQNEEGQVLQGATFTVNSNNYQTDVKGFAIIAENKAINAKSLKIADIYSMTEIIAPDGYKVYAGTITLTVTKKQVEDRYEIDQATIDETAKASNRVRVEIEGNTVTIIIIEEKISGEYTVRINKQNQKGEVLKDAIFKTTLDYSDSGVIEKNITTDEDGYATIIENLKIDENNLNRTDTYTIKEIKAPKGYIIYDGTIALNITKRIAGDTMVIDTVNTDETTRASKNVTVSLDKETNTVTVIIKEDNIDLSLRKFITKVTDNTKNTEIYTSAQLANRVPDVDTTKLKEKTDTTAEYNHTKKALHVSVGDIVSYTLRVYNEGESDAYITEVTDYLPYYLKPMKDNEEWYIEYGLEEDNFEIKLISSSVTTITGSSNNLSALIGETIGEGILLPAFDKDKDILSYIDVQVMCEVLAPEIEDERKENYKITNIAEITGMLDKFKNEIDEDIDSIKDNVDLPEYEEEWENYKETEIDKEYIPGQQDDDDFEKVKILIPKYDLSLRKFITKVNEREYDRAPQVDTASLKQGILENSYGTATYNHTKEPITVSRKDIITYTIRVYNEGNANAYVSEITDYLPAYLEFMEDDELNKQYGWKYNENTRIIYTNITSKDAEDTAELYSNRENGKILLAFDGGDTLDYIDVQIRCRVSENSAAFSKQTNIAEITGITDTSDKKVTDVDSTPKNEKLPEDENLPNYKDDELDKQYIPGQEDDDDFEKVFVKGEFDLALRKFISKVNTINVNNRYPEVGLNENGKIKYTHTKNPVEVCYGDTVIYTIRVYNEGEVDGYANEITDDVPDGLEFIVDNEVNKEYRWKMLDENHEETTDVNKAKYIVTDFLSEEQSSSEKDNLIKAFDKTEGLTDKNPDYRDVKIAFKVTYKITDAKEESRILVNVAQISKDSDDDIDSIPNRDEKYNDDEHEDDIDYEQVKVKYFDLSLLKWVSNVIMVENGKTTITNTGHTGEENPEPVVKVEIRSKSVNSIIVKFGYKIRIKNEGEIAGYAKEITDYIPEGLKFIKEDNPDWYERDDNRIATKQLENLLLQPGETAEVEVILTWINGENNLGTKINIAEISQDYNPSKTPDIDSTPDNEKEGEDDIDDAPVMLVIKTGIEIEPQYSILACIVLTILTTGTILIKKFVL